MRNQSKKQEIKNKEVFWTEEYNPRLKDYDYKIDAPALRVYLKNEGYRLFKNEPIKLTGRVANKVTADDIFNYTLRYVETFEDKNLEASFIKMGEALLLRNKAIIISLQECELRPLKDSEFISYKFYDGAILKVEKNKAFEILKHEEIDGFIWQESIIKREFKILDEKFIEDAIFAKFIKNITNNEEHFKSICSAVGYLLHNYKDQRKPVAIIVNDENLIDDGKPQGGTGKGLLIKGLSKIVEKALYNGKNADFTNNKFAYQNVSETSNILFIDDAPRNFNFEALFSVLTEDMPIERKHQPVLSLPYKESPKFVITTNYTIKGTSSSFKRRRFDVFLNNYYHASHTPADDFGNEFFHGWDEEEWNFFDFFMMACLRLYLSMGFICYKDPEWELKILKNETSPDFIDFMQTNYAEKNVYNSYVSIREEMIAIYGEKYLFLKRDVKTIIEWVDLYANYKELKVLRGPRTSEGFTFCLK